MNRVVEMTDYELKPCKDTEALVQYVRKGIGLGWQPYGELRVNELNQYEQVMVKYKEVTDE